MKIGIITAMSSEQKQVEQLLANKKEYVEGPFQYTEGTIQNNTVILMKCGIGKVNAAAGTVELIRNFHPDCIISTGVAGGIDSGLKVMDVVAGSQIVYHDVWCGEGNAYGQIQGLPALFEGNDTLFNCAMSLPNEMNYVMDYRLIYCLRNGLPLDMDVYDAAEWSCITELSEKSVLNGSIPVEIPDFTRGVWEKHKH